MRQMNYARAYKIVGVYIFNDGTRSPPTVRVENLLRGERTSERNRNDRFLRILEERFISRDR